jgi:predicted O-methyltransferase YrrM
MNPAYSDPELLEWTIELSKKFNTNVFLETGTYHGGTAKIISEYFDKVITIESNADYYNTAVDILKDIKNCECYLGSSPDIMNNILKDGDQSVFFFLDAHWENYWPILDELKIIQQKNITPVIAIHDFFVPDENDNAKFGFDHYQSQPLDFKYIEPYITNIYNNGYEIRYSTTSTTNSGVIYIYPKTTNDE